MEPITLLLVDDQPAVRRGLRMRLEAEPDLRVIAEAADGATAVRLADLRPAVVVMDIQMPGMDGLEATRTIRQRAPGVAVVALSLHDDPLTIAAAVEAGATAFVAKRAAGSALIAAIRRAAENGGAMGNDPSTT